MKWLQFLQTTQQNIAEGICCSNKLVDCPTQLQFQGASTDNCLALKRYILSKHKQPSWKKSVEGIDLYWYALWYRYAL